MKGGAFTKWNQNSSSRENKHKVLLPQSEQDRWHTGRRERRKKMTSGIDLAPVEAKPAQHQSWPGLLCNPEICLSLGRAERCRNGGLNMEAGC